MGEVTRTRMNANAKDAFTILYAVGVALRHVEQHLEPLAKRIPNGWRDIRLAEALLDKCVDSLMDTIPIEQLNSIRGQMKVSTFKIVPKPVGKDPVKGVWVMDRDDITALVKYAVDGTCMLCDGKQKCELRNLLDEVPVKIENDWFMPCRNGVKL